MKKLTIFFIFVVLIGFVSCDTLTRYTMSVPVDRNPTLTIVNQTGHPVAVTTPVARNIGVGGRSGFQPAEPRGTFNVTYTIAGIQFTEQVTMDNADATVTLTRRPPTITLVNNTGYPVVVTDPVSGSITHGASADFLAPALNRTIPIVYRIGQMHFSEQVTIANQDVTVTLTRSPPWLTVVNNTGLTVNMIFMRIPGSPVWNGGNITVRGGRNILHTSAAAIGDLTGGSIINGDSLRVWMGDIEFDADQHITDFRFDVRMEAVGGVGTFVRSNVQILNDITLPFTPAHRP